MISCERWFAVLKLMMKAEKSRSPDSHAALVRELTEIIRQTARPGQQGTVFAHHARVKLLKEVLLKRFAAGNHTSHATAVGMIEILNDPQAGSIVPKESNDVDSMTEVVMDQCLKDNRPLDSQVTIDEVKANYFMTEEQRRMMRAKRRAVHERQLARLYHQGINTAELFVARAENHKKDELIFLTKVAKRELYQTANQYSDANPNCGPPPFNTNAAKILLWHSWSQAAVIAPRLCDAADSPGVLYWQDIFPNQQPYRRVYIPSEQALDRLDGEDAFTTESAFRYLRDAHRHS